MRLRALGSRHFTATVCGCALAAAAALALPAGAAPARVRVAIPAIQDRDIRESGESEYFTSAEQFARVLGLWLRESGRDCPSLEFVSQARADAIMAEVAGGAAGRAPADVLLREHRRIQPVDALVFYRLADNRRIELAVASDAGVASTNIELHVVPDNSTVNPVVRAFAEGVRKATAFIAGHLPLPDAERKVLSDIRTEDPDRFAAIYLSQGYPPPEIWAHRPEKPFAPYGLTRLSALLPRWRMDVKDPALSLAVVRAAHEMILGYSVPVDGVYRAGSTFLQESAGQGWVTMTKFCFVDVLGTRDEPEAYPLARLAPTLFVQEALETAKPLFADLLIGGEPEAGKEAAEFDLLEAPDRPRGAKAAPVPRERRLGALRVLGQFDRPESNAFIKESLEEQEADVREAAAVAAGWLPARSGAALLRPLLKDGSPRVAFAAAVGLWRMGEPPADLAARARAFAADPSGLGSDAVAVLTALGDKADVPLLAGLAAGRGPQRAAAVAALLRHGAADGRQRLEWLSDCDAAVIGAVLASSSDLAKEDALRDRLEVLANDPYAPVALRARFLLARHPPADPRAAMALDLKIEHPYVREQIVEKLAADGSEQALGLLAEACDNRDHHVRARALQLLAARDPARARPLVAKALADLKPWVSFHAAALAPLVADAGMLPALRAALERADHSATRLYLREAIAKAGGGPAPEQPEPARSIRGERNLAWNTAPGHYAAESPFDAYYCQDTGRPANMHKAHDAGKILFARTFPIRAPVMLVLDLTARDAFVPRLDEQLSDEIMTMLDGVIYGEETMEFPGDALWDQAWSLFCRDAKLDPVRIDGKIDRLNPYERRAWNDWTWKLNVRGFNKLADFTRLRYGKLRPGLQVGSFQIGGPEVHCDFAGVYDYKGDNRLCAYDLVRNSKTACPDRPVIWLSLGIGGYEMNPVHNTDRVPVGPLFDTYDRSWSDSLTAWLAGAENGWFSTWIFINPKKGSESLGGLRGKQVWVEDIRHDSPILADAIDYAHDHVKKYEEPVTLPTLAATASLDEEDITAEQILEDPDEKQEEGQRALNVSLANRAEEMTVGFLYYQQYVYNCARVFASLPRLKYRSQALVNRSGVDVWTRPQTGNYPLIPAQALLNRYDYVWDLNQVGALDLSGYRLFVTHDPQLLRDGTIHTVTRWLREAPGLLVVHRAIAAANDAEASTVEDHDGRLEADWPWESEVAIAPREVTVKRDAQPLEVAFGERTVALSNGYVASSFELKGPHAKSLATVNGQTVLALWRDPAFKGAVLFDGMQFVSSEYLAALRETLNALHRESGIGMRVEGPALLETLDTPSIKAAAATRYYNLTKEAVLVPGLDALGASLTPVAGRLIGSTSGLTLRDYVGRFAAASDSLNALSEKPFAEARVDGDGLVLKSPGVIRLGSASGTVVLSRPGGKPLPDPTPVIYGPESAAFTNSGFARWLFASEDEGVYELRRWGGSYTYVRSRDAIAARPGPPAPLVVAAGTPAEEKELDAIRRAAAERERGRRLEAAEELVLDLGAGAKMPFVKIKALGLWAGKYEVTNQEFRRFRSAHASWRPQLDGDRLPVVCVSYDDAVAFAAWVNGPSGAKLPAGFSARLPDGREWTALAQCGDGRLYPWGPAWPPAYGNYADSTNNLQLAPDYRDGYEFSCPVEQSGRNEWGLFGVGGNVWEWTGELTEADSGWRIRRGGFWGWEIWGKTGYESDLRCAHRSYAFPSLRHLGTGFRLVLAPAGGGA